MMINQSFLCRNTFGRSLVLRGEPSFSHYNNSILLHDSLYTLGGVLVENSTYCAGENLQGAFHYHVYAPRTVFLDHPPTEGPADCFWLGYFHDHFGHFLTSTLQRLWYLRHHKQRYAGYIAPNYQSFHDEGGFIVKILDSLKIDRSQILSLPENSLLKNIDVAEPSFIENSHCYDVWSHFMRDIGQRILGKYSGTEHHRPVFLSRHRAASTTRRYDGEDALGAVLEKLGIELCYPESLTIEEQLKLWASHSTFIGFSGSAFMNAAFFQGKTIIVLNHDGYIFGTQRMIDESCHHKALYLDVDFFLKREEIDPNRYVITDPEGLAAKIVKAVRSLT